MNKTDKFSRTLWMIDALALALTTWVGFVSHGETTAWRRMPSTWVPLLIAWTLAAHALGLFTPSNQPWWRQILRLLWAGVLAAPLAAWLRGLWLGGAAVTPLFPPVLGAFTVLFVSLARLLYTWLRRRRAT